MASDAAPLDPRCSILFVSAVAGGAQFLLQKLLPDPALVLPATTPDPSSSDGGALLDGVGHTVPWTIANKYYTADVAARVHPLHACPTERGGVPALVYVWANGEPYRAQVRQLVKCLYPDDFEVALAVRVPASAAPSPSSSSAAAASAPGGTLQPSDPSISNGDVKQPETSGADSTTGEADEDSEVDAYLADNGFEFIDIRDPASADEDVDSGEPTANGRLDIPSLGRVVDALSTIMWPSLVRIDKPARMSTWAPRPPRNRNADALGGGEDDDGADPDLDLDLDTDDLSALVQPPSDPQARHTRVARQLAALERWLEDDGNGNEDGGFLSDGSAGNDDDSGGDTAPGSPHKMTPALVESPMATGFDDDFTMFVSAPPPGDAGSAMSPLPVATSGLRADSMTLGMDEYRPRPRLGSSASFGSTFNFTVEGGGEREHEENANAGHASGRSTPAQDNETHLASHSRLGGGVAYHSLGSVSDFGGADSEDVEKGGSDEDLPSQAEIAETSQRIFGGAGVSAGAASKTRSVSSPLKGDTTDPALADLEAFDLQSVLSALQGLKEEIALMSDDAERRRAAARVALGLVYGIGEE